MGRLAKSLCGALCVLALGAGIAQAAETAPSVETGATPATPTVTSVSTSPFSGVTTTTYSDGTKVLENVGPFDFSECPEGWVCLWDNPGYQGRMLQFQSQGYWQELSAYGFNDQTTAWGNRTGNDAKLAQNAGGGGTQLCLQPHSNNSELTGFNNEASSIKIFTTSTVC